MSEELNMRAVNASFWGAEAYANILSWPDENLVRFLGTWFPDRGSNDEKLAVEIGCGNGRNLFALKKQGFQTMGIEISEVAASSCRKLLANAGTNLEVLTGAFQDVLPSTRKFDLIVWDSPCLENDAAISEGLLRVRESLNFRGMLWIKFRHPDTWFFSAGKHLEGSTWLLDERAGPYAGAVYSFYDGNAAESMLLNSGFSISNRERVELWKNNESERHAWTIFWAEASK